MCRHALALASGGKRATMPRMKWKTALALLLLALVALAVVWMGGRSPRAAVQQPGDEGVVKLASLHPLLSEMARRVGGEHVQVVNLFPAVADLHSFTPTGADVAAAAGARMLLACGKGVEPYLRDLRDSLPEAVRVLELGEQVPDVLTPDGRTPDPHWWNTPENMKRASHALLLALQGEAPAHAADFAARQRRYAQEMDELTRRAKLELARIPAERRVLVSAHAAMCHFCAAFHFTPIAVQGVAHESEGDTAQMAQLLAELRAHGAPCVFPDAKSAPTFLQNIADQLHAELRPLYMDGICPPDAEGHQMPYEELFMHNVRAIRAGLGDDATKS